MTLQEANASDDTLTRLEALAGRLALQIDESDGGHGFGVLCREYRQTVEAIAAIRKTGERPKGIDDLVSGKPGPDLRRLSVV